MTCCDLLWKSLTFNLILMTTWAANNMERRQKLFGMHDLYRAHTTDECCQSFKCKILFWDKFSSLQTLTWCKLQIRYCRRVLSVIKAMYTVLIIKFMKFSNLTTIQPLTLLLFNLHLLFAYQWTLVSKTTFCKKCFLNSDTHCLQTNLLIFKFCQPQNKRTFVSTANNLLVGTLMTIDDVTVSIAIKIIVIIPV